MRLQFQIRHNAMSRRKMMMTEAFRLRRRAKNPLFGLVPLAGDVLECAVFKVPEQFRNGTPVRRRFSGFSAADLETRKPGVINLSRVNG